MADLLTLVLLDSSVITSVLILAFLSKRLGSALKIKPYYRLLYVTAVLIAATGIIDITIMLNHITGLPAFTLHIRGCAAFMAVVVCLRYWKWLFSEFFGA